MEFNKQDLGLIFKNPISEHSQHRTHMKNMTCMDLRQRLFLILNPGVIACLFLN